MAYKGTAVTSGTGEGVVVATGMATELGHLAPGGRAEPPAPLENRLDCLAGQLVWITLGLPP